MISGNIICTNLFVICVFCHRHIIVCSAETVNTIITVNRKGLNQENNKLFVITRKNPLLSSALYIKGANSPPHPYLRCLRENTQTYCTHMRGRCMSSIVKTKLCIPVKYHALTLFHIITLQIMEADGGDMWNVPDVMSGVGTEPSSCLPLYTN